MERELEIQKFHYFEEGNFYAGQKTKDPETGRMLRYRVEPFLKETLLRAYAWTEDLCFERAKNVEQREYPLTEEGLEQAVEWLESRYQEL